MWRWPKSSGPSPRAGFAGVPCARDGGLGRIEAGQHLAGVGEELLAYTQSGAGCGWCAPPGPRPGASPAPPVRGWRPGPRSRGGARPQPGCRPGHGHKDAQVVEVVHGCLAEIVILKFGLNHFITSLQWLSWAPVHKTLEPLDHDRDPTPLIELDGFASGHVHRVRLMLSLLGLPFREHEIDLPKGEHKAARVPGAQWGLGQVPVLRDGDLQLADSNAICVYLAGLTTRAAAGGPPSAGAGPGAALAERGRRPALAFGPSIVRRGSSNGCWRPRPLRWPSGCSRPWRFTWRAATGWPWTTRPWLTWSCTLHRPRPRRRPVAG